MNMQIEDILKENFVLNFQETMQLRKKVFTDDEYLLSSINEHWQKIGLSLDVNKMNINYYPFNILDKKKLTWAIIQYNLDIFS